MVLAVWTSLGLAGCHAIDYYDQSLQDPVPPGMEPARELSMVSLPAYRIEPPDLLRIDVPKLVPLPPYRIEPYDALEINVIGTLLDQPINNYYLVEGEGTVNLGPAYGTARVAGMTLEEAQAAIDAHLRKVLKNPVVSVRLARASGMQPIATPTDRHGNLIGWAVGPDGTVNLRQYGSVEVAGLTLGEAKAAIEKHLSQHFDSPQASVGVVNYNSKVFYIITEGANAGDQIVRVAVTGNETVLDAISLVGGLSQLSSKKIFIARPAPGGFDCEQILPVDWDAIAKGASTATNYQIMPDDRVFIVENKVMALTNLVNMVVRPFETVAGFTSLNVSMIRNMQTTGRNYNRNRR